MSDESREEGNERLANTDAYSIGEKPNTPMVVRAASCGIDAYRRIAA